MHTSPWQIHGHSASLRAVGFAANLELAQSAHGLKHITAGGETWTATSVLGLAVSPLSSTGADAPGERHVRGNDLVLAYQTAGNRVLQVEALWRSVSPELGDKFIAAIDLIVSVCTPLLDVWPELAVQSALPIAEMVRLTSAPDNQWTPLADAAEATVAFGPDSGVGCILVRPAGLHLSYAEMVHPVDFCHSELFARTSARHEASLVHQLFRASLEKGVLLRARVRGVFVPRIDDTRIAAECYAAFAAGDLPLET